METRQGLVTKLRASIEVSGTDNSTSTSHVVNFLLDAKPVMLRGSIPPAINEGDSVKVAGTIKKGLFEALAYRNESTGARGDCNSLVMACVGGLFFLVGAGGVLASLYSAATNGKASSLLGVLFFGVFAGFGTYALRRYAAINKAITLLGT